MRSATRAIAIALSFLAIAARAEPAPARRQVSLVIGFVAFNSVETSNRDLKKELVAGFLRRASDRAAREGLAVRFDVVQGNYYQVLHWLRAGAIDGAVLSPFTYDLLLGGVDPADPAASIPAATFPTAGLHGARDGGQPMFRVVTDGVG